MKTLKPVFNRARGLTLLAPALAGLLAACSPSSPKLVAPPERYTTLEADGGDFKTEFNPKVDILFVIDNSASMKDDQELLSRNIDRFVKAFAGNDIIDYHIGVVSVADRIRQTPNSPNFYPSGQLRPLKTPGQVPLTVRHKACTSTDAIIGLAAASAQPGFITRQTPEALETLRESLKIGVQCLEDGGPEFEELFTPVAHSVSRDLRDGANRGFYRDDAHLAVIIVSDAMPSNAEMGPDALAYELRRLKSFNNGLLSTHAIGIRRGDPCKGDPSTVGPNGSPLYPERLEQFVSETGGRFLSLCDKDWGSKLADIGTDIRRRTLGRVIRLNAIPEAGTIEVRYGSQVIPPDLSKGWSYDEKAVSIVISGDVEIRPEPGAEIVVKFTPVNLHNLRNGRAERRQ